MEIQDTCWNWKDFYGSIYTREEVSEEMWYGLLPMGSQPTQPFLFRSYNSTGT